MYKILYTPKSEENLEDIFFFIAKDNPLNAAKVLSKIKYTADLLSTFPLIWAKLWKDFRIIVESKYKFKIVYKIKQNTIYIISIFREQGNF